LNNSSIKTTIAGIPEKPGIYQFINQGKEIIYIGKAKNLKKRISSYFNRVPENRKLQVLVSKIDDIIYFVVDTESDALLLENSLIKEHQPRYNVLLKDDKTYPWICIKNEPFQRIFSTRKIENDGSEYFGPYTSVLMVKTLLELIKKLFYIRTCAYNLSNDNIQNRKYKICLEYHLKNCMGPCEGLQRREEYETGINQIRNILKGNLISVIEYLGTLMKQFSDEYRFEEAEIIRQKLIVLKKFQSKSTIVNTNITNVDVFSITENEKFAAVNYFKVVKGAIIQSHNLELISKLNESKKELLSLAIDKILSNFKSNPVEIIIPFIIDCSFLNIKVTVPKIGDKRKLLDLSIRNSKSFLENREKYRQSLERKPKNIIAIEKLKDDLRMKTIPDLIECFDNSNIQGSSPVASCVVFKNGKPSSSDYRHFNIKTVTGADDFASMSEVIYRRYKRIVEEGGRLPTLIIVDGGKGQLNAALKSLKKLEIVGKVSIISIAKKLEEIFVPNDPIPIYLDKNSLSLKLIQQIRNEAHRFGISFHKQKRSKAMLQSDLDNIKGVGTVTKEKLLTYFGDIEHIKKANRELLERVINIKTAKIVYDHYHMDFSDSTNN
jgi:excinuclease ABC subunit C